MNIAKIDSFQELGYIIDYVKNAWTGVDVDVIVSLWDDALEKTKLSLDAYAANEIIENIRVFQEKFEKDDVPIDFLNHSVPLHSVGSKCMFAYMDLCRFEKNNRSWTSEDFEGYIKSATPKYWQPLYEQYNTREDIEKYMQDKKLPVFLGNNFLYESKFEDQVGMENVMYFAKEQDTSPENSLAYAISRQAMLVNKHNNKVKMISEWVNALDSNNFLFTEPLNVAWLHFMVSKSPSCEVENIFNLV